jgi:hypothetical protein
MRSLKPTPIAKASQMHCLSRSVQSSLIEPRLNVAQRRDVMSDLKDKAKDRIDAVAEAAKKATEKVVDKTKDAAHAAGKKLEEGAKKLKDALREPP